MESNIKTKLKKEEIKNLVRSDFPGIEIIDITEMQEGNICSTYKIRTSFSMKNKKCTLSNLHISDLVLKVGMKKDAECLHYEKDLFPTEYKVYQLLQDINIPKPKILKADMSCKKIPAEYIFMEFLEGKTWNQMKEELGTNDRKYLMEQLGEYNARINSVKGDYFGYLKKGKQHQFRTHKEAFLMMIYNILLDGKMYEIELPYEEIKTVIGKHQLCLNEVIESRLIDFDLWAGNVLLNKEDRIKITGIIDFGHCFYGDVYAAFTSAVHLLDNVEEEPDFIRGYENVSGKMLKFTDCDRIRMDLYRLYMALICAVETYRYEDSIGNDIKESQLGKVDNLIKKLMCF